MKIQTGALETLCCPYCGDDYLHHEHVTVQSRPQEDCPSAPRLEIEAQYGEVKMTMMRAGWAGRRHDLSISFRCEICAKVSHLCIEQHKGQTLVFWHEPDGSST